MYYLRSCTNAGCAAKDAVNAESAAESLSGTAEQEFGVINALNKTKVGFYLKCRPDYAIINQY